MTKKKITGDDDDLFRRLMSDVKPLETEPRTMPAKARPAPRPRHDNQSAPTSPGFIEREHASDIDPEEALFFARSGPQQRLLRQLKRGELRPEARLDLHGHTIAEAGARLSTFLTDAQGAGLRCVCIIHGKGYRSAEGHPALKTQVNQWLRDTPTVLAFSSTRPRDGGMGALYVLLRRP
ncbi:MAG TPA: DNA mismatch repair protein MutS [Chromatiales bacterium]|nr:DNA mismatch repair protein MutS [Chromatiales bacterium]HEX22381.1 DNA mismatch repair protein MutS [Chromatiales bacterium]